jgi:hypothetical protein
MNDYRAMQYSEGYMIMFSVVFQFARNVFEERNTNNMNQIIWREQRQYSEGYVAYCL